MKKFLAVLLATIIVLSFAGCGNENSASSDVYTDISTQSEVNVFDESVYQYTSERESTKQENTEIGRCAIKNCKYLLKKNSTYCSVHACLLDSCVNIRVDGGYYCAKHDCDVSTCKLQALENENYCEFCKKKYGTSTSKIEVTTKKCIVNGCDQMAVSSSQYCITHLFSVCYDKNCSELKVEGSYFCSLHKCKIDTCTSQKASGQYCSSHAYLYVCTVQGCEELKDDSNKYCTAHSSEYLCNFGDCVASKTTNSNYCTVHKCSASGCKNAILVSYYCKAHTCGFMGCGYQAVYNTGCCSLHKCAKTGCSRMRTQYTQYCSAHS